jgi:outer membrane protein
MGRPIIQTVVCTAMLSTLLSHRTHALDLNQAYQLALINDPQFNSAKANFKAAREKIPQAAAALKPTVNWTVDAKAVISKNLASSRTSELSDISRSTQTESQSATTSSSSNTSSSNGIDTSGSNTSDSTNASILKESSNLNNSSEGWTEPLTTNRSRSLASALVFSMPLYRPVLTIQLEQSKLIVEQAEFQLQAAKTDAILRVSQAYFDAVVAEENNIAIAAQKQATIEQLASAKNNFEVGSATITDVHEAQARFDLVRAQEINFANELIIKTAALRAIIGVLPSPLWQLKKNDFNLSAPHPAQIDFWLDLAGKNSYSVLIQKSALQIAQKEINKQHAAYKPTLDLNANAGVNRSFTRNVNETIGGNNLVAVNQSASNSQNNTTNNASGTAGTGSNASSSSTSTTNSNSNSNTDSTSNTQTNTNFSSNYSKSNAFDKNASIGIQFVMPLYDAGLKNSRVREAMAQEEKVIADLNTATANAILNTNKAYFGVVSSLAQVSAYEVAAASNEMAVNSNKLGYAVGMRLNIDVLNAQQQLFATRRDLARARIDTLLSGLQLKAAVGKLTEADIQGVNQHLTNSISEAIVSKVVPTVVSFPKTQFVLKLTYQLAK